MKAEKIRLFPSVTTLDCVLGALDQAGKRVSRVQLYRYLRRLELAPVGARQRPQLYPADTADRILEHFGLSVGRNQAARLFTLREVRKLAQKESERQARRLLRE